MTDDSLTREELIDCGYLDARQLASGVWIAIGDSIYTRDLYLGMDKTGWRQKWMYEDSRAADQDFAAWDGEGDPPGPWVKSKPDDRWNPKRDH